jgi:hypothetical protein
MMCSNADNTIPAVYTSMPNFWKNVGNIKDGTSNTMAASEAVSAETPVANSIYGGVVRLAITADVASANLSVPQDCLNMLDPSDRSRYLPTTATSGAGTITPDVIRGNVFTCGRAARSGFTTNLPPNSPSCVNTGADSHTRLGFFSATSSHTGGVSILLFDGSVQFISQTIDTGRATDPQAVDGAKSPYGVWGGLGTIGQRETITF